MYEISILISTSALVCCLLLLCFPSPTHAQLPRICADNATLVNATCCPTMPGLHEPCGGFRRGVCLVIPDNHELFYPALPKKMDDDRVNWPKRFFTYGCRCKGNFFGFGCHECKWGYFGRDCNIKRTLVRRNFVSYTPQEQHDFINLIKLSKKVNVTDYVAIWGDKQDPIEGYKYTNLTYHDYFVYVHAYGGRNTHLNSTVNADKCNDKPHNLDFGHQGTAFPTYHRTLMLFWERAFRKLANNDTLMLPYWDWIQPTQHGKECVLCTNEFLGASNWTDKRGFLDSKSEFSKWRTRCQGHPDHTKCRFCHPLRDTGPIIRKPGGNGYGLPFISEIDDVLGLPDYDGLPYTTHAPKWSFRNCFEGNCPMAGDKTGIHNKVHDFFNGSMAGVITSVNDPIFILHHIMIDRVLEMWIRRHTPHITQFPSFGGPYGHHRHSRLVPFYPLLTHSDVFVDTRTLGYTYDNFYYGGRSQQAETDRIISPVSLHLYALAMVSTCIVACIILLRLISARMPSSNVTKGYSSLPTDCDDYEIHTTDEELKKNSGGDLSQTVLMTPYSDVPHQNGASNGASNGALIGLHNNGTHNGTHNCTHNGVLNGAHNGTYNGTPNGAHNGTHKSTNGYDKLPDELS